MSYSFEDHNDGGSLESSVHVNRGGLPRWLLAMLGLGAFALFATARSSLPDDEAAPPLTTAPTFGFTTTTTSADINEPSAEVLVTSPPGQLTHDDADLSGVDFSGLDRSIALRDGSTVVVINPETQSSHIIELPVTQEFRERNGVRRDHRAIAMVAGKLVTYDDGFLRSLSVNGGVDVLLSNSSHGFEVATPTAIIAATEVISSSNPVPEIRLVPQGVHFPSARDQVVGVFGVPDLDLLPVGAEVSVVDGKIFVDLNGELHRKSSEVLVSLGSGRAFAASENSVIIERCLVLFENCSYFQASLADLSLPQVELSVPLSFSRSDIVMSADGDSLVVIDDGTEQQTLVDISTGSWIVEHEFSGRRFGAAIFDSVTQSWILAYPESLVSWTLTDQVVWELPVIGEIDQIAIAPQVG